MADVKWVKIYTDMINNKKIKRIRKMPSGNDIILIWVFLIAEAGKCNKNGGLFLTNLIPFSIEDLAIEFDFEIDTIKLALSVLQKFEMIDMFEEIIYIKNWEEYQNIDGMDKIREQTKKRVQNHRQKQQLQLSNATCNVTVTQGNAIEQEKEIDKDIYNNILSDEIPGIDINVDNSVDKAYKSLIDDVLISQIVYYLNEKCNTSYKISSNKTKTCINARANEGFVLEDFKKVIDIKATEWMNTDMAKYLRPETLFGTKFESYLNQKIVSKQTVKKQANNKFHNFPQKIADVGEKNLEEILKKKWESKGQKT